MNVSLDYDEKYDVLYLTCGDKSLAEADDERGDIVWREDGRLVGVTVFGFAQKAVKLILDWAESGENAPWGGGAYTVKPWCDMSVPARGADSSGDGVSSSGSDGTLFSEKGADDEQEQ